MAEKHGRVPIHLKVPKIKTALKVPKMYIVEFENSIDQDDAAYNEPLGITRFVH